MAVVSVCSTKGGVGKTTLVICLADAYGRQGGSVAIIDADYTGIGGQSTIELFARVNFNQWLHAQFTAEGDQITQE